MSQPTMPIDSAAQPLASAAVAISALNAHDLVCEGVGTISMATNIGAPAVKVACASGLTCLRGGTSQLGGGTMSVVDAKGERGGRYDRQVIGGGDLTVEDTYLFGGSDDRELDGDDLEEPTNCGASLRKVIAPVRSIASAAQPVTGPVVIRAAIHGNRSTVRWWRSALECAR